MRTKRRKRRCIVCGLEFAARSDARCCSGTCRMRLQRGRRLAYLDDLPPAQRQARRALHDALDAGVAAERAVRAAKRERRVLSRRAVRECPPRSRGPQGGGGFCICLSRFPAPRGVHRVGDDQWPIIQRTLVTKEVCLSRFTCRTAAAVSTAVLDPKA